MVRMLSGMELMSAMMLWTSMTANVMTAMRGTVLLAFRRRNVRGDNGLDSLAILFMLLRS